MSEQPNILDPQAVERLQALLDTYNIMIPFLDIGDDDRQYFQNMASLRTRCDEIVEALTAPFLALRSYIVDEVGRVMTEQEKDKVTTDFGTFYFTSPSPAVYIKGTEQFLAKLEEHPEVKELLDANLTVTARAGSLVFRKKS